ncbi:MAG: nucleotidyltransferase domain-containing protein, partial [Candidatus Heimdallarchaeota archaeon]
SIREREFDFIRFGGTLTLDELSENRRVPGVDKRLMLIAPTELGHKESPVMGFESIVAKKVGVNVELVKERVRVLTEIKWGEREFILMLNCLQMRTLKKYLNKLLIKTL